MACYKFWQRNGGRDRPFKLIKRLTEKDIEAEIVRQQQAARGWEPNV